MRAREKEAWSGVQSGVHSAFLPSVDHWPCPRKQTTREPSPTSWSVSCVRAANCDSRRMSRRCSVRYSSANAPIRSAMRLPCVNSSAGLGTRTNSTPSHEPFCRRTPRSVSAGTFYEQSESLDLYFAHYFPANLGKLQIVLLDLLRAGRLPAKLHFVDLGDGPRNLVRGPARFCPGAGCHGGSGGDAPLPLQELSLRGYDRSQPCLDYARKVMTAFGETLAAYGDRESTRQLRRRTGAGVGLGSGQKALADIPMRQADLGGWTRSSSRSRVWSSCRTCSTTCMSRGSGRVRGPTDRPPQRLPADRPGTGESEAATQLMRVAEVAGAAKASHWRPILPCGQEFGNQLPAPVTVAGVPGARNPQIAASASVSRPSRRIHAGVGTTKAAAGPA